MSEIIKQEQGRSMVEMLGVLAVVGVLSVGGIAGYTYAMDKHKSNELLNEASKRAVIVAAQIAAGREPSLREFEDDKTAGGTISIDAVTDIDGAVGIKVTGVKDSVCENLIKLENDRVYMAKDDASLTELNEADCSGDSNEFLIVFENMGGGSGESDSGTTITCDESEKVYKTYYTGECCEVYHGEKLCPDDVPADCVKSSPACDCEDKACCDNLDGSWAVNGEGLGRCCPEGTTKCPDWGVCLCVPSGYDSTCGDSECAVCSPSEGTPKCSSYGDCICVPSGYSSACNEYSCITCSPSEGIAECQGEHGSCQCMNNAGECSGKSCCDALSGSWDENYDGGICCAEGIAKCPDWGVCICIPDGYSSDCAGNGCKACSPEEGKALCPEGDGPCICVPNGYDSACNGKGCIVCSPSEGEALCPHDGGDCICAPSGYDTKCNSFSCISCSPTDGTALCSADYGDCICVPENYSSDCSMIECKACSPAEGTALCPDGEGNCICVPDGYSSDCGEFNCKACPSGQVPRCEEYGPCTCLALDDCSDQACCNTFGGSWAKNSSSYICCVEGTAKCPSLEGGCICEPSGYTSACSQTDCKACSPAEGTAVCPDGDGNCKCVPKGYSWDCNNYFCTTCSPENGNAICDSGDCWCE